MKALLIAASAIALASPALAQTTGPSSTAPAGMGSTPTPPVDTAMPASSAAPQEATAAAPADPKAIIASEFPSYDKDSNGALSRAEFDTWLVALKEKAGDTAMKPADKTAWLKTAFTTADKDKNKGVSLAELTDYLTAAS